MITSQDRCKLFGSSKILSNQDAVVPNVKVKSNMLNSMSNCNIFMNLAAVCSCADLRVRAINGVLLPFNARTRKESF